MPPTFELQIPPVTSSPPTLPPREVRGLSWQISVTVEPIAAEAAVRTVNVREAVAVPPHPPEIV